METPAYTKMSTSELHQLAIAAEAKKNMIDQDQYQRFYSVLEAKNGYFADCDKCPIQKECFALPQEEADKSCCEEALFIYVLTGEKPS